MKSNIKELGTIKLSNMVVITDPCYDLGIWCQGIIGGVKAGIYDTYAIITNEGDWGERIAELIIVKQGENPVFEKYSLGFAVGVDSGQAGIFDYDYFVKNQPDNDFDNLESWYRRVCDITCSDEDCGVIDNLGVVASSGYGDGTYDCYAAFNDNFEVVGLRIVFIEDTDDDEN